MTASAGNGFMDTSIKSCAGRPFTFHAEYSTASPGNVVPWGNAGYGVNAAQELGHAEVCAALAHRDPFIQRFPNGQSFTDKNVFDTCVGGSEGRGVTGEGGCNPQTGVCLNPTTQWTTGPIACPSNIFTSLHVCEYADGICLPKGTRTIVINGHPVRETMPVAECNATSFAGGDVDFDGTSYQRGTWPDGTSDQPTSFRYVGPFDPAGHSYPQTQFVTDGAGSEFLCELFGGQYCTVPPLGSQFYPYWTITSRQAIRPGLFPPGTCAWNFGSTIRGVTTRTFGRDAEYGQLDPTSFGTIISAPIPNPEFNPKHGCRALPG